MEKLRITFIAITLLLVVAEDSAFAQKQTENTSLVSCSIRLDDREWTPKQPATVYVTVESLSDNAFEIPLWSALSLEPASWDSSLGRQTLSSRIMAALDRSAIDPFDRVGVVIKHGEKDDSALLRFVHKGEKAKFKFNRHDLIWSYEVINSPPTSKLFAIAKPGRYKLQFQISSGPCESAKLPLTIAAAQSTK